MLTTSKKPTLALYRVRRRLSRAASSSPEEFADAVRRGLPHPHFRVSVEGGSLLIVFVDPERADEAARAANEAEADFSSRTRR